MQLTKQTIAKLQQKSAAADIKIKELRAGLLEHVTVDLKSAVVISPKFRDDAKRTVQSIEDLEAEKTKLGELIDKVKAAAVQLNCDSNFDFQSRRSKFLGRLGTAEHSLKVEKLQLVPRLDKIDEFERIIADSKTQIAKFGATYLPLADELAQIEG